MPQTFLSAVPQVSNLQALYPIGDRARRSGSRGREEKSVNQKPKSVTHVLNHRCYLCPDCTPTLMSDL